MEHYPDNRNPSWHDNLIYGLHLQAAEPDAGRWRSNLILDIDHIVEWVCGTEGGTTFRVAPATLTFRDVTDLRIKLDFGGCSHPQVNNELSIAEIASEPIKLRGAVGSCEYFQWLIEPNLPKGGKIAFGASGYTQELRAEPVLLEEQRLRVGRRPQLILPSDKSVS